MFFRTPALNLGLGIFDERWGKYLKKIVVLLMSLSSTPWRKELAIPMPGSRQQCFYMYVWLLAFIETFLFHFQKKIWKCKIKTYLFHLNGLLHRIPDDTGCSFSKCSLHLFLKLQIFPAASGASESSLQHSGLMERRTESHIEMNTLFCFTICSMNSYDNITLFKFVFIY